MNKVLVIGGAGFIGFHLSKNLAENGVTVDILDNFSRGVEDAELDILCVRDGVRLIQRDLLDPDALDGLDDDYDAVLHLAAIIGVKNVLERPYAVLHDNVTMLFNAINFARRQKNLKRLLFTSTSEVYAGTLKQFSLPLPTPEDTPLAITALEQPRTSYMLSKIYGEGLLAQAGIPFTIIRPHNIYGPRMGLSHVIPELLYKVYQAEEGSELEVYSIDHSRSFCFVDDAVNMTRLVLDKSACENQTLNLGAQNPEMTIGQLADIIMGVVGKQLKMIGLPATPGSPVRRCPDMTRTIKLTGYHASVSVEEGVRRTYQWYKDAVFESKGICAL